MAIELRKEDGLAYRQAVPDVESGDSVVLLHGFPESSRMWEPLMADLAATGHRCLAPDLYGLGDSDAMKEVTFESTLEAFSGFIDARVSGPVILVVHDWGGFIGLAWACEHRETVAALVISNTGFFADGKWHGMAEAIRGKEGEAIVGSLDRDGFASLLRSGGDAFSEDDVTAYWSPFADGRGQQATLEFYRSMDFEKLRPWQGCLAELDVPALVLWGADDEFAPLRGGERFAREIPGAELVALDGVGHFLFDQDRERPKVAALAFLAELATPRSGS